MAIEILMPALSPTMETGTLATWNVAVGDAVRSGDVIALSLIHISEPTRR